MKLKDFAVATQHGRSRRFRRVVLAAGSAGLMIGALAPHAGATITAQRPVTQRAAPVSPFGQPSTAGHAAAGRVVRAAPSIATTRTTLYVTPTGNDVENCRLPKEPCQTISYAVTQAPNPSTILVAAGTYPEQVTITSGMNVTIVGQSATSTQIAPIAVAGADPDTGTGPPVYAIVDVQPGAVANLLWLTVDGSAAKSTFNGCARIFAGIYYHDASGAIGHSVVDNIVMPDPTCQGGLGVYASSDSTTTTPSHVTMTFLTDFNYGKNGITCSSVGTTCSITKTTVTGAGPSTSIAQNGIEGNLADSMRIATSTVSANTYSPATNSATGILMVDNLMTDVENTTATKNNVDIYALFDANARPSSTTLIKDNTASNATGSSGDGIVVDGGTATLTHNTAYSNPRYGIGLFSAVNSVVQSTSLRGNRDGIYVGDYSGVPSSANTVQHNYTSTSTNDGILASANSTGNSFVSNTARNNVTYGYQDMSTGGGGTNGTSNSWHSNGCNPVADSSPLGLC